MNGSRIWVDLSALFSCTRKQSCIYVDHEKFRTVKDVEEHICRLFSLKQAIHIQNDGWLLPSSESSLLLRDNDIVSVVPEEVQKFSQTDDKLKDAPLASKCKELNGLFKPPSESVVSKTDTTRSKLIVTNSNGPVILKENGATSSKNSIKNPFAEIRTPSLEATKYPVVEEPENNDVANKISTPPVLEDCETTSEIGSECRKRKRIRRRKKKSATETNVDQNLTETKQSRYLNNKFLQSISYTLSTVMVNNMTTDNTATSDNKRKHIFFDEPEEKETNKKISSSEPQDSKVVERVPLAEEPKDKKISLTKETMSKSNENNKSQILPTISSPARGDGALGLAKLMSLGNQKSPAVFERKKADKPKINEENANVLIPQHTQTIKLTPLNELPVKETIIQFQVLKMCNYSPVLSAPIKARVISPDMANKQIYVQIQEGLDELKTEKGKFSLDPDASLIDDDVVVSEYLYLDWKDLIEPKAIEYV